MKTLLKFIGKIISFALLIIIVIVSLYTIKGYSMYKNALEEMPIKEKIEEIKAKENYTNLDEIPEIYKNAVVAVEDHRFYEHSGIDIFAIIGAIVNDLTNGSLIQGGSTITQQLCKNVYFTQDRKIERKIAEVFMADKLEKECSKDEILELYINTCFYGNNCYTLKEASNLYYDKEPAELNNYEATLIAGIPNAPSLYNPIHSEELSKKRQKQVLYAMVKYGYITNEQRDSILEMEGK